MGMTKYKPLLAVAGVIGAVLLAVGCRGMFSWEDVTPTIDLAPTSGYADTLIVAADLDYQPYSFRDEQGSPTGYDVELIYHLAEAMGKNVEIQLMSWVDAQQAVHTGQADILLGLDYNMENLAVFELSLPLTNDPFVAFGNGTLTNVAELSDKRLATLDGSGSFAAFLAPFHLEGNTKVFDSYRAAFQSVAAGESDYAIAMYSVGRRVLANLSDSSIKAVGPVLAGNYLCIGTRKGNMALAEELNGAITALKRSGTIDKLSEKWLGRYVEVISLQDYIAQNLPKVSIIMAALVVLAALLYVVISHRLAKGAALRHEMTKRVLEYQQLLTEATKGLYESIYEIDITHNRAGGEGTCDFFESLDIPRQMPYDQALRLIAQRQIQPEFIQGYLDTFSLDNVMAAYQKGVDHLSYDFLVARPEVEGYYWMRITARVFYWMEDNSVRMITYRQNIDAERRRELAMEEQIRADSLSDLYNRRTMEELTQQKLAANPQREYAFIMMDIDNFKQVNDSRGHVFGDYVITEIAATLKRQAEPDDLVGRVGGDEFVMLTQILSLTTLEEKATAIVSGLCKEVCVGNESCHISLSMGIAIFPQDGADFESLYRVADKALYQTKAHGKNGYTIFCPESLPT